MKVKKKGRVHPSLSSPSPSSSSSPASYRDPDSVFKLFPVAILAPASALPTQDQEVLAYMITRSIISTTNPSTSLTHHHNQRKNKCRKGKVPLFQCGCFDCYTRFWHRWDSSPNRDLIHQAIEAFEDHLLQNEVSKKHGKAGRKKAKVVSVDALHRDQQFQDSEILMVESEALPESENSGGVDQGGGGGGEEEEDGSVGVADDEVTGNLEMEVVAVATGVNHKGLARKVLPDVVGLFNSRLWSLWGPSI